MKIKYKILCLLLLKATFFTYAQSGGDFNIKKSTTDAGGGQSSGGDFTIKGTIGQADAITPIAGGSFVLTGGFWPLKPVIQEDMMFKDSFEG